MALTSFCGLLTLQVGAAILAAVFFTLAGVILAANIFDYYNDIVNGWFPFSLVFMLVFVIGLIIAGALMFISSYQESRSMALLALVVIVILICYWVILCCFSLLSNRDHVRGVCIQTRCPETFWLANLRYRIMHRPVLRDGVDDDDDDKNKDDKDKDNKDKDDEKNKKIRKKRKRQLNFLEALSSKEYFTLNATTNDEYTGTFNNTFFYNQSNFPNYRDTEFQYLKNSSKDDNEKDKDEKDKDEKDKDEKDKDEKDTKKGDKEEVQESPYYWGSAMIGAIILFIINLIFLIFSALVIYSWASELDWDDDYYYEYDDPVVIVEDY